MKKNIKYIGLIGLMDIELIPLNEIEQLKEDIFLQLGWVEASLNYFKQKKFKTNVQAQKKIAKLNYDKKYYTRMLKEIDKRTKRGW